MILIGPLGERIRFTSSGSLAAPSNSVKNWANPVSGSDRGIPCANLLILCVSEEFGKVLCQPDSEASMDSI